MEQTKKQSAFTLIEVLAAFALLAILLATVIQAQGDMLHTLESTGNLSKAIRLTRTELLQLERRPQTVTLLASQGTYDESHEMPGAEWEKLVTMENFFGYPFRKVVYKISWNEWGRERDYEDFIYLPPLEF